MKHTKLLVTTVLAAIVMGCVGMQHPILICPEALKDSNRDWTSLREALFKLKGVYWLTDDAGQTVQIYRYRSDYIPIIEPRVMPDENNSESSPQHISSPIILKRSRKGVVLHLVQDGKETTIPLGTAAIERHGDYDVLQVP